MTEPSILSRTRRLLRREVDPRRFLPYARHVDDHVIALDHHMMMMTFSLSGQGYETSDIAALNAWHETLNTLWRALADPRLSVWTHIVRAEAPPLPQGQFRSGFARALDEKYRARLGQQAMFENRQYLTLVARSASAGTDQVAALFRRAARADSGHSLDDGSLHDRLHAAARDFEKLGARLAPRRLTLYEHDGLLFSEPLELLERLLGGRAVRVPLVRGHLGNALYGARAIFGAEMIEIRHDDRSAFTGLLGVRDYPAVTRPGQLDGLLGLPFELTLTQSFTFLGKAEAAERLRRKQNQMISTEDPAASQMEALFDAADDLQSNRFVLGEHHLSLSVQAPDLRRLNDRLATARAALADGGIVAAREGPAVEAAYWAQLPGNFSWRSRPAAISSRNFAALSPFHGHPAGRASGNHWGDAVTVLRSAGRSPYHFNFHRGDLGHSLIIGPSGSGKTVIQNFLLAQLEKLDVRQIFIDKDRGAELFVRASGGTYLTLRNGQATGFAPLRALADTPSDRAFLGALVRQMLFHDAMPLSASEERLIDEGLAAVMRLPASERSIGALRELLGQRDADGIGARLERWAAGGPLGWVLDSKDDVVAFDTRFVGFDMTDLLDNAEVRAPVMLYLFHRIDQLLEGQGATKGRTVIDVDEFWKALGDQAFRSFAQDGLKTFRKRNALLVFGTQSPADALASPIAHSIIEQVATQILLPNPRGRPEDYVGGLGLTDAEFRLIREELSPDSRRFLVKQGHVALVVELDLTGLDDELAILSGRSDTVALLDQIRAEVGDDPTVWLPLFHRRRRRHPDLFDGATAP